MTIGLVRGLLTLALFSSFIGLWIWAWSSKRTADFTDAAALPLLDGVLSGSDRQPSTANREPGSSHE